MPKKKKPVKRTKPKKKATAVPRKKQKVKKATRQTKQNVAGSYLTTRGQKKKMLDAAFE